ncbi:MAG: hypothetical protein PSX80_06495 [bacterium]|nr:hypothetical protein [bacterium]
MNKTLAVLFVLAFPAFTILAQEPLVNYKDRTIAQIIDLNKTAVDAGFRNAKLQDETELVGGDPLYSKVTLQFLGSARPVSDGRKKLISSWGRLSKIDKKATDLYVNEIKFAEGSKEYWLGIPNSLIPMIAGKIKKGESASLYVSYTGAFKPKDQKDYESVLIITAVQ